MIRSTAIRPTEAPLHMPAQAFGSRSKSEVSSKRSHLWRKYLVFSLALALTAYLCHMMYDVLALSGVTWLEWLLLVVFVMNIAWIALAFMTATCGFIGLLFRAKPTDSNTNPPRSDTLTAITFPIYNENVSSVFASVEATANALANDAPGEFECFILSDTNDPDIALQEEAAFEKLKLRTSDECNVFYRRRTMNVAKKSGNIHDFVSRWGNRYAYMIVYDADSFMETQTLKTLVRRMESDSELGLIQTVPKLIGGRTFFARIQQFAASLYGPVLATGMAWWSQNEGNYWGHNAIIRTKAFAQAAGLPHIPGKAPFGGHILSHDFVEAALLRRAGWKVRIDADLTGSYEEGPPTMIDLTIRDRRWCQGNLQHIAVLARTEGLTFSSRIHLLVGIMSYLASPLWLCLILVGMALSLQNKFMKPDYFGDTYSLTPQWPVIDPALALSVFSATLFILLAPKLFGLIIGLMKPDWSTKVGSVRLVGSVITETLSSALLAPIMMAAQTSSVVSYNFRH